MLLAFGRFNNAAAAKTSDKRKPHIRNGGGAVKSALLFHLKNNVLNHFLFVCGKLERARNHLIALDNFRGRKPQRNFSAFCMVADKLHNSVQRAVNRSAADIFIAEVRSARTFAVLSNVNGMAYQFVNALVLCRGNRHNRYSEHFLHFVDIHGSAVSADFVHHIKGKHNGYFQLHELKRQIKIALNICGVNNIYDTSRLLFKNKAARNQLFARIRRKGIYSRQIRHLCVGIAADCSVFTVNGDPGKITDVLI